MKNSQKGFLVPLIVILVAIVAGGSIYYYFHQPLESNLQTKPNSVHTEPSGSTTPSSYRQISSWKIYSHPKLPFTFQYPADWNAPKEINLGGGLILEFSSGLTMSWSQYYNKIRSKEEQTADEVGDQLLATTTSYYGKPDPDKGTKSNVTINNRNFIKIDFNASAIHPTNIGATTKLLPLPVAYATKVDSTIDIIGVENSLNKVDKVTFNKIIESINITSATQAISDKNNDLEFSLNSLVLAMDENYKAVPSFDYSNLCLNNQINVAGKSHNNLSPHQMVDEILKIKNAKTQSEAGIICIATKGKFAVSVPLLYSNTAYCIDSSKSRFHDRSKADLTTQLCKPIPEATSVDVSKSIKDTAIQNVVNANEAEIKSKLLEVRASAENIYNSNSPVSFKGVCEGKKLNNNPQLKILNQFFTAANISTTCFSTDGGFSVTAQLIDGKTMCVYSGGLLKVPGGNEQEFCKITSKDQDPIILHPNTANASTDTYIYSNLGPADSYDHGFAEIVGGKNNVAVQFRTGKTSFKIKSAELPLDVNSGEHSLKISVVTDSGHNSPGTTTLTSATRAGLPAAGFSKLVTVTFNDQVTLLPNTSYWIVAEAADNTTESGWYLNESEDNTNTALRDYIQSGGDWINESNQGVAIRINGLKK